MQIREEFKGKSDVREKGGRERGEGGENNSIGGGTVSWESGEWRFLLKERGGGKRNNQQCGKIMGPLAPGLVGIET